MKQPFAARTLGVFAVLFLASCFGDGVGPGSAFRANIVLAPNFDNRALLVVDVNRALVRFTLPGTNTIVKEEIADWPAGEDTLELSIALELDGPTQQFDLTLLLIDDPAGDTLFRSGPELITAVAGSTPTTLPTAVPLYVGPGSNATGIRFVASPASVYFGQTAQFTAEAFDVNNVAVPTAPITYSSSNPAAADVDAASGAVTAGIVRGNVQIKAELPRTSATTPPAEVTSQLVVQPVASGLAVRSGSGQTGPVGGVLQPVTVRVMAADNLGVQGITVNFAVVSGGGSLSAASAVSDASGDASVTWTLGGTLGSQVISATVPGLPGGTINVPATGTVGPPAQLVYSQAPLDGLTGFNLAPAVRVAAQDAFGHPTPAFTGPVSLAIAANPGSATLSGGGPVNAVAGEATFPAVRLSAAGAGYTLMATSGSLTSVTSAVFNITNAVPTQLAFVQQPTNAVAGSIIAPPVQVAVQEAGGATVPTATDVVTIAIANNPGGGTLAGTASVAAVAGIATFNDLSIDQAGTGYTLSASSGSLTSATSATFDITPAAPTTRTWTGAVSTDWFTAGNWSPAGVPAAGDNVVIPSSPPRAPLLTNAVSVHDLDVQSPMNQGGFSVTVSGTLSAQGGLNGGIVQMTGAAATLRGSVGGSLLVNGGQVSLSGSTDVGGSLTLQTAASLTLAGRVLNLSGSLAVNSGSTLTMTNAADRLNVGGDVTFAGDDETGKLTAGVIEVDAGFTQLATTTATSFVATGTLVRFTGTGTHTISFATPASSRFGDLELAGSGALTLTQHMAASGRLIVPAGSNATISSSTTRQFQFVGADVDGLTLDNTTLSLAGGTLARFDNVTFQNYPPAATPLSITNDGAATPITFTSIVWSVTPTTGHYLDVTDTNPVDGLVLTITLANTTPADGSAQTGLAGGAVVNWAAASGVRTWTGAVSTDFNDGANWSPPGVPGPSNDVVIPVTANAPVLSAGLTIGRLTVETGTQLSVATHTLIAQTQVIADGQVVGSGQLTIAGPPVATLRGTVHNLGIATTVHVNGPLTVMGALANAGVFNVNGQIVTVAGTFVNQGGGGSGTRLQMQDPFGRLTVAGFVRFQGDNQSGLLTDGTLEVGGDFIQNDLNSSPQSFFPTGNFVVRFIGSGTQNVLFDTPGPGAGASRFQHLELAGAGPFSFTQNLFANGQLRAVSGASLVMSNGSTLNVTGLNVNGLTVTNASIVSTNGTLSQFNAVTFQGYAATATPLTISHPGAASPFVMDGVAFQVTPTAGGFYLAADDNTADANTLTLELTNATPTDGSALDNTTGGAVINWVVPTVTRTWTGAVSANWSDPGNWSPAGVPTAAEIVSIVPTATQPVLDTDASALAVTIAGAGAQLTVGPNDLIIGGGLTVHTDGLLVMTDPGGVVIANDVAFQGGNETGLLSAGELRVRGSFFAANQTTPFSFAASGTHRVAMIGTTGLQGVHFQATGTSSGFRNLDISASPGINMQASIGGVNVFDTLSARPSGPAPRIYMLGSPLRARRFNVDGLIVDRGTLTLDEAGVAGNQQFDNVTFENYQTTQTQLAMVVQGGGARTMTFNNVHFQPLSAGNTGRYLNIQASAAMTLDLPGATPGNGPAFTVTSGGATVNWPVSTITWTGAVSSDWNAGGNWSGGVSPVPADNVLIPAGTPNQPAFTTSEQVRDLTVATGASLGMGAFNLTVTGNLHADGPITGTSQIQFANSAPVTVRGVMPGLSTLNVQELNVNGPLTTTGNVTINGSASILRLNGNAVVVGGSLSIQANGRLIMTNAADALTVSGSFAPQGADHTGLLTAGTINLSGDFVQTGGHAASFASTGTRVNFAGSSAQSLRLDNAGTSFFHDLVFAQLSSVTLMTNVVAQGQLISPPGATAIAGNGRSISAVGLDVDGLLLDNGTISSTGGTITRFDNVMFQQTSPTAIALAIAHPGAATPFTFTGNQFLVTPTSGFYVRATDNVTDANVLTITLHNSTPADGSALDDVQGGAVINWTVASTTHTWTGAVTAQWNLGANWSQGVVPPATEDVVIPTGLSVYPVLANPVTVRHLTIEAGATLDQGAGNTTTVTGSLDALGGITGTGTTVMAGPGPATLRGSVPNLDVGTSVTLLGPVSTGMVTVGGPSALLRLDGNSMTAFNVTVNNGARLVMDNPSDVLQVNGNARFEGADQTGLLTDGTLIVGQAFLQVSTTSPNSFVASGNHVTRFTGFVTQNVLFDNAGTAASHFHHLELENTANFSFTQALFATGALRSSAGATPVVSNGSVLNVAGLDVGGLTLTNALIKSDGGTITRFDNVTFTGYAAVATALEINHPGPGSSRTFSNVTFAVTPTAGGNYFRLTDTAPADGQLLQVDMVNPNPATPGPFAPTAGGAVVNWPASAAITWTGAVNTDWSTAGNWSGGVVPTATDDVVIPAGTPNPVLNTAATVRDLTIQTGVSLDLVNSVTSNITVMRDLDATGGMIGSGSAIMTGPGTASIRGTFPNLTIEKDVTLNGPVTTGFLGVSGSFARFRVNGNTVIAGNSMTVSSSALLVMTNPADLVQIAGIARFRGADETGFLTAGRIRLSGNFIQDNSTHGFVSTGTMLELNGTAAPQTISFTAPSASGSRFAGLEAFGTQPVTFTGPVFADSVFIAAPTFGSSSAQLTTTGKLQVGASSTLELLNLTIDGDDLQAGGGFSVANALFTAGVFIPRLPYNNVTIQTGQTSTMSGGGLFVSGTMTVTGANTRLDMQSGTNTIANLVIEQGGMFDAGGGDVHTVNVATSTGGLLHMSNVNGRLINTGALTFAGGDQTGHLTGGTIEAEGNFSQVSGTPFAFVSTGTRVRFIGSAPKIVDFANPAPGASHFHDLEFAGTNITLNSGISATGVLQSPAGVSTVEGLGHRVTAAGLDVDGLSLNQTEVWSVGGTITRFDNVQFTNTDDTKTALNIIHPGAAAPFTFNNIVFGVTPATGLGLYIGLDDNNTSDGLTLTLNMLNATPATPLPAHVSATNGAVLNWPFTATLTWTGGVSGDWSNPANWSGGTVPLASDDVTIPASAPNVATLSAPAAARNLTVLGNLNVGPFDLAAGGDVSVTGLGQIISSGGNLIMTGVGRTVRGTVGNLVASGSISAAAAVTAASLTVSGSGTFSPAGFGVQVNGPLATSGSAGLVMSAGTVSVIGDVNFAGTGTSLTGGLLSVLGNFAQQGAGNTFVAGGSHRTIFDGGVQQTVSFQAPGTIQNRFQDLRVTGAGGVSFITNAVILGHLEQIGVAGNITDVGVTTLTVGGDFTKTIAQIGVDTLVLSGALSVAGASYGVTNTVFAGVGQVIPNNFIYGRIYVTGIGATFAAGTTNIAGELAVNGGELTVGAGSNVIAAFVNVNSGLLHQTGGVLTGGNFLLAGGDGGVFSGGTMNVGGNFTQSTNPNNFEAGGTHTVVLNGGASTVTFSHPGLSQSHFHNLTVTSTNMSLAQPTFATGQYTVSGSGIHAGNGHSLRVSGLDVDSVVLDNLRIVSAGGSLVRFNRVRFQNHLANQTPLTIDHDGSGTPVAFDSVAWTVTPVGGAFYLDVNDSDGPSVVLTIDLSNATPANGSAQTNATNGAVVNWVFTAAFTWTGAVSTDWHNQSNWSGGVVPTATDDAVIAAGTPNGAIVTGSPQVRNLTVAAGATLTLGGGSVLLVGGNLDAGTTIVGSGELQLTGAATTMRGTVGNVLVGAAVTLSGDATVTGSLMVGGTAGTLTLGGFTLTAGSVTTTGVGRLVMNQPTDLLVANGITFGGGDETGLLTQGVIRTDGNFTQSTAGGPSSFVSLGTRVELVGAFNQQVNHDGGAIYAGLVVNKTGGTVDIVGPFAVLDSLAIVSATTVQGSATATVNRKVATVAGSNLALAALQANGDSLQVAGAYNVPTTVIGGGTTIPVLGYADLSVTSASNMIVPATLSVGGTLVLSTTGTVMLNGSLAAQNISLMSGELILNGQSVFATTGSFVVANSGLLTMTSQTDQLDVAGDVSFAGPDQTGRLTDGIIRVRGNFQQLNIVSANSFVSQGTDVLLNGTGDQVVTFASSVANASRFSFLHVSKGGGSVVLNGTGAAHLAIMDSLVVASPTEVGGSFVQVFGLLRTAAGSNLTMTPLVYSAPSTSTLLIGGQFNVSLMSFFITNGTIPALNYFDLATAGTLTWGGGTVSQLYVQSGELTLTGNVVTNLLTVTDLAGSPGRLVLGGNSVTVNVLAQITGGSLLTMTNPADVLQANGGLEFAGGDHTTELTAGVINVLGDFIQSLGTIPSANSFVSEGTRVVLAGAGPQTISFATPGSGAAGSHFHDLQLDHSDVVTLASPVFVDSQLVDQNPGAQQQLAGAQTLTVGGADVDNMSLDQVRVVVDTLATFTRFDNVMFANHALDVTQLQIRGLANEVKTFNGLLFSATNPTTGFYADVRWMAGTGSPFQATLNSTFPVSSANGGRTITTLGPPGGAALSWNP